MSSEEHFCQHLNEIIDHRAGAIVCTDCGIVISNVYLNDFSTDFEEETKQNEYVLEILSRLQLPEFFKHSVVGNLEKLIIKDRKKENAIAFVIYKTLHELNCGISIKDISAVTGFTDSQIYNFQSSNDCIILDPITQLEKYCIILNLPKNSHTVIKGDIEIQKTGHNPTTILATAIYNYCKKHNLNLSMSKIAKTLNISCVSIQRYIKWQKKNKHEP